MSAQKVNVKQCLLDKPWQNILRNKYLVHSTLMNYLT